MNGERNESMVARSMPAPTEVSIGPIVGPRQSDARPVIPSLGVLQPAVTGAMAPQALQLAATESKGETLELKIDSGDTLDQLFRRHKLRLADLAAMVALPEAGPQLARVKPGDQLSVTHQDGRVLSLRREVSLTEQLLITQSDAGFSSTTVELDLEIRLTAARGMIETSLFEAGIAAGLTDNLTVRMAKILQWDIDFILDPRAGDSFTVIYQERWRDGIKLDDGHIVATEYVNRGSPYRAARYVNANGEEGYFDPHGRSVQKAFLRAPVEFARISSNFNPNRRHPVLNTIRAHRGVDYAAPTGTPIIAAGDGTVRSRGVNGGYGNAVVIQHGGGITTLYGHMSRFGRFGQGSRVKQGDVVGYVGKSGLATGPHLHYEYRLDGVHRNPRTVALPPADPVPPEYNDDFVAQTTSLWTQLDLYSRAQLADAPE
jgi:murein DD-endopeptidase MepM/ murein hydrolase activator NlpD